MEEMKITISTIGSRGDVQPYLALGKGLADIGYEVTLAADSIFESFVQERGLAFARLAADPMKALEFDIRTVGNNPFKLMQWMARLIDQIGDEYFETYLEANRHADLMIFSSVAALAGVHVGAALNVPMISTTLQPVVPTRAYPYSAGFIPPDWIPFRGTLNKASYKTTFWFLYRMFYKMINRGRKEVLGLAPLPWRVYASLDLKAYPMLHGFSRHVLPKPPDYNQNQIFTGYWFLDQQNNWQLSKSLFQFLAEEPKPVYVGFGSMVDKEADALTELVVEALEISGQRAVLLGGWTDLGGAGLPDTILKVDSIPHNWLFPRVAAAVHHGGAGTTAASLRAGIPTVVVPFFADQPFWGWRVEQLCAGPKPVPRQKLTASKLVNAISLAVKDQEINRRAFILGQKIRAEDGVANAVQAVKYLLANRREALMPEDYLRAK